MFFCEMQEFFRFFFKNGVIFFGFCVLALFLVLVVSSLFIVKIVAYSQRKTISAPLPTDRLGNGQSEVVRMVGRLGHLRLPKRRMWYQ